MGDPEPMLAVDESAPLGKPFTVRTEQARRELGLIPRVTWKDGIAEMTSSRAWRGNGPHRALKRYCRGRPWSVVRAAFG